MDDLKDAVILSLSNMSNSSPSQGGKPSASLGRDTNFMNYCQFCQEGLSKDQEFDVIAPDGKHFYSCMDCMNDIFNFFKSGKAEKEILKNIDEDNNNLFNKYATTLNSPYNQSVIYNTKIYPISSAGVIIGP